MSGIDGPNTRHGQHKVLVFAEDRVVHYFYYFYF
jgi:hypothetical protein